MCVGLSVPAQRTPEERAPDGIVVRHDGSVLEGIVLADDQTITVKMEGHDVYLPRTDVRWFQTEGTTLTVVYWQHFGSEPIEPGYTRPEGEDADEQETAAIDIPRGAVGIVVLRDGTVLTGEIEETSDAIVVRSGSGAVQR